jgi:large subunit ribosomal protein L25
MAEMVQLTVQPRDGHGTIAARRLRKQGLIPAVIYGHKQATVAVALPRDEFEKAIRQGSRVLDLALQGNVERTLIQDVQWDHLGQDVLHADFRRVSKDERVQVEVRIHLRGTAPGVKAGGVLDQPLHVIEVECLVTEVPESIRVNVGELQIGGVLHVRDLVLPPGVTTTADPDAVVVQVTAPQAEAEAEAAAPAAEQAEPERIGRQKAEEPGEEEKK